MRRTREHTARASAEMARFSALPSTWVTCPIGEVAKLQAGYAFKSAWFVGNGIRLLRGTNIEPGRTRWNDVVSLGAEQALEFQNFMLRDGDIVIAMDRPLISSGLKVAVLNRQDVPSLLLQRVGRFLCSPGIDPQFLYCYLNSPLFVRHIDAQATGTQLPHISATDIETAPLPLPPFGEQQRIATRLGAIQARSRRAREALDEVPALLEKLRQSILAAAFRGDLTKDWRAKNPDVEPAEKLLRRIRTERRKKWEEAELIKLKAKGKAPTDDRWKDRYSEPAPIDSSQLPELPEGWCWTGLSEIAEIQLGQRRAPEYAEEAAFPYVRAANITWRGLDLSDVKSMGFADPKPLFLQPGDVLLSEASGSAREVGKPAMWRGEIKDCCFQATVLRVRPASSLVIGAWLYTAFLRDAVLGKFAAMAPGVGILHLTADRMRAWPMPLAPLDEQRELTQTIERSLERIYRLEDNVAELSSCLVRSNASILAKAFRGELVPQDPADEPADVMLARLRASAGSPASGPASSPASGKRRGRPRKA